MQRPVKAVEKDAKPGRGGRGLAIQLNWGIKLAEVFLLKKMRVKRTETKTLPQHATRRHVFLCFYLCEVEGAGKNENVHQVDEAL